MVTISWGEGTATPEVTDTVGNTYSLATSTYSPTGDQSLAIYYAKNIVGGANRVKVSLKGYHVWRRLLISEYSGIDRVDPVDTVAFNTGNATTATDSATSGAGTTTTPGDLIFGAVENYYAIGNFSAGSGYTLRGAVAYSGVMETGIEDKIQELPGPVAAKFTFSATSPYLAQMVAFRPAAR